MTATSTPNRPARNTVDLRRPWAQKMLDLLADGEWHDREHVAEQMKQLVPAADADRVAIRMLNSRRRNRKPPEDALPADYKPTADERDKGAVEICSDVISTYRKSGRIESEGDPKTGQRLRLLITDDAPAASTTEAPTYSPATTMAARKVIELAAQRKESSTGKAWEAGGESRFEAAAWHQSASRAYGEITGADESDLLAHCLRMYNDAVQQFNQSSRKKSGAVRAAAAHGRASAYGWALLSLGEQITLPEWEPNDS